MTSQRQHPEQPTEDEKKAAQKRLDEAVEDWIRANKYTGLCTGWILSGHMMDSDGEDDLSSYVIAYMHGSIPDHVARGLLSGAADIIRGVGRWSNTSENED